VPVRVPVEAVAAGPAVVEAAEAAEAGVPDDWRKSRWLPEEIVAAPQGKGFQGRNLCRWCHNEVPPRKRSFCGPDCVHQWKLRRDPVYVRQCVWNRDKGVCAECGTDTDTLRRSLCGAQFVYELVARGYKESDASRTSLWDADHIVPVAEGGGCCGLEGYATLCLICHRKKTASWNAKRSRKQPQ